MTLTRRAVLVALTTIPLLRAVPARSATGAYGAGYRAGGYR